MKSHLESLPSDEHRTIASRRVVSMGDVSGEQEEQQHQLTSTLAKTTVIVAGVPIMLPVCLPFDRRSRMLDVEENNKTVQSSTEYSSLVVGC